ncbi:hypothetical protein, partial [Klebsiella pneumoniae]|uniref:hypothetical protein n=1 Tax=Klebsiella pneumoniae TaxID=573 RepID=UPI003531B0C8
MHHLSQKKCNLKKGNNPISEYLGAFKSIWDELDVYAPITNDLIQAKKLREQDRIFEVLAGLPHDFEHLRSQILMSNELPSLSSVFSMLIREESRRKAMGIQEDIPEKTSGENVVFAAHQKYKGANNYCQKRDDKRNMVCS